MPVIIPEGKAAQVGQRQPLSHRDEELELSPLFVRSELQQRPDNTSQLRAAGAAAGRQTAPTVVAWPGTPADEDVQHDTGGNGPLLHSSTNQRRRRTRHQTKEEPQA
ncbi:hypothetical protein MRX96_022792 [Rhipicephalus microplus]